MGMLDQHVANQFAQSFTFDKKSNYRGIGIECEMPVVTQKGESVSLTIIQDMFAHLETKGFELKVDNFSNLVIEAKRKTKIDSSRFSFKYDTITTEAGCGIIEIIMAPQSNLHDIQAQLNRLLLLLTTYFEDKNCKILGYGIQPVTSPSRKLIMPKERYLFYEKLSTNFTIPKSIGSDSSLLSITASNQCHVQVDVQEAIPATNVLNALSGLQIALQANSPIWKGSLNSKIKANREIFWNFAYPKMKNRIGVPQRFESIEHYVENILGFRPLLVKRDGRYYKVLPPITCLQYFQSKTPIQVSSLNSKISTILPKAGDIHQFLPFVYFNARLAPAHGTVESRMCCQQPPHETLTTAAMTLGIVENLNEALELMYLFPQASWKTLRKYATQDTLDAKINGKSIIPFVTKLLNIAKKGLVNRQLGEEIFLEPLYERLIQRQAPADKAIEYFNKHGLDAFIENCSFRSQDMQKTTKTIPHSIPNNANNDL